MRALFNGIVVVGCWLALSAHVCANMIAGGTWHSLLVDDAGRVWASGGNNTGQLGNGDTNLGYNELSAWPVRPPTFSIYCTRV